MFYIFQTTVWSWIDPGHYRPDLSLILTVYLGFTWPPLYGGIMVVVFGLFNDAVSGGPTGLTVGIHLIIFVLALLIQQRFDPSAAFHQILALAILAALAQIMTVLFLWLLGWPLAYFLESVSRPAALISIASTALVCPFIFRLLNITLPIEGPAQEEDE